MWVLCYFANTQSSHLQLISIASLKPWITKNTICISLLVFASQLKHYHVHNKRCSKCSAPMDSFKYQCRYTIIHQHTGLPNIFWQPTLLAVVCGIGLWFLPMSSPYSILLGILHYFTIKEYHSCRSALHPGNFATICHQYPTAPAVQVSKNLLIYQGAECIGEGESNNHRGRRWHREKQWVGSDEDNYCKDC